MIENQISNNWIFELKSNDVNIVATNKDDNIKISYDTKEDIFSFVISDEDLMSVDKTITLENLRGKVVLINFWATWCGPCRMEIPDFNELYKKYNDKGLEILSISISDSYEQLIKFKNAYNMFYPILYGDQKVMMKIQREYGGIYSIPMSFLVNKKGEIIRVYPGAIIKQFELLFKMDDIDLEIKEEALLEISKLAVLRKTGARGLRSIMEDILIDLMFESPDQKELKKIVINCDVITNKSQPILLFDNKENNQKLSVNKS